MHVKKGDTVVITAGKDKGKKGVILEAMPKQNRVLVEGVNMVTKHQKPNPKLQTGGIIQKEAPIHASNVMLFDKKSNSGTRVRYEIKNDKKVRVAVKSGEILD
jgi:large subunit ribosomal protein L24